MGLKESYEKFEKAEAIIESVDVGSNPTRAVSYFPE